MRYGNPTAIVLAWLGGRLSDSTDVTDQPPTRLTPGLRRVVIGDAGGPGDQVLTLDVADLAVDCYADHPDSAADLAEEVRSVLRLRLPATTHNGVFVKDVSTLARPAPVPYDVAAIAKVSATYRLHLHAAP